MADTDFIAKTPQLGKSQDYAFLRSEGLKHIERLAHRLWTDYNVHDPGITILEHLCYALTELGYRTGYGIEDLLTEIADGVPVNRADFHTARDVFTNRPVSFDDLRKILIDVRGVRNAWIEKHTSVVTLLDTKEQCLVDPETPGAAADSRYEENPPLNGLYDVFVEYERFVEPEPRVLRVGLPDKSAGDGGYVAAGSRGIRFDVDHELTLVAVSVYPEAAGEVRVRLVSHGGEVIAETGAEVAHPGEKNRIALGFRIPPGEGYRLNAQGSEMKLYRTLQPAYPYSVGRLIRLVSGVSGARTQRPYYSFFDWELSYATASEPEDPASPQPATLTREDVRLAVLNRLHGYRNLGEDFVNVRVLETEEIKVCADLEVRVDAELEQMLAEIFYQLEQHISPTARFYTIEELVEKGMSTDEIFAGPRLAHGFIDDDEFRRILRKCEIRTSDVVRILMDVEGVVAVKGISLLSIIDGKPPTQEDWILRLTPDRAPALSLDPTTIVFYKKDLPYFANRDTVEKLLEEKRLAQRSKLEGHARDLPVSVGEFRDVETYFPFQNALPAVYGVGRTRVPDSRSERRKAQARQLKAYLLIFEQLLANYLSQLAHVRELFSWREAGSATYFTQEVTGIADLEEIYHDDESLARDLGKIIEDPDSEAAAERRSRFLEHLVARFAEDFTEYGHLMKGCLKEEARSRVIGDKRLFLADYPRVGRNRGGAYNYRDPGMAENVSGFKRRVSRLLGIRDVSRRDIAGDRFRIEEVPGRDRWWFVLKDKNEDKNAGNLFESNACESRSAAEALLDFALGIGGNPDNYQLNSDGTGYDLVVRCPQANDRVIGTTTSVDKKVWKKVGTYFAKYADAEGLHVVEHILLRKRTSEDPYLPVQLNDPDECECVEVRDPYSFRVTVLLPSWPQRFQELKFRRFMEEMLRREAPAHVYLKICWISHDQMKDFEVCYNEWAKRLASLVRRGEGRGDTPAGEVQVGGQLPLPAADAEQQTCTYRECLEALINKLHSLVTVFPLAGLHDCRDDDGDTPQITLNNTSLGTF